MDLLKLVTAMSSPHPSKKDRKKHKEKVRLASMCSAWLYRAHVLMHYMCHYILHMSCMKTVQQVLLYYENTDIVTST